MTNKKKIYISGKIGDLPISHVTEKFDAAEHHYINNGWDVVNPMKLPHNHNKTWASYMLEDLSAIVDCDAIVMLPCYIDSAGAAIELLFAKRLGIKIIYHI